jgi:hypothetical protein
MEELLRRFPLVPTEPEVPLLPLAPVPVLVAGTPDGEGPPRLLCFRRRGRYL